MKKIVNDSITAVNELSKEKQLLVRKEDLEKEINEEIDKDRKRKDIPEMDKALLINQLNAALEKVDRAKKDSNSKIDSLNKKISKLVKEADESGDTLSVVDELREFKKLFDVTIISLSSEPDAKTDEELKAGIKLAIVARDVFRDSIDLFNGLDTELEIEDVPGHGSK